MGDKLESENQIGLQFGISRQTVRQAIHVLVQQGILISVQGSGTYVKCVPMDLDTRTVNEPSKMVTIISTYVDGYIFLKILQAMTETLEQSGYGVRIMFTSNQIEKERKILEKLLEENCRDPLIVEPVKSGLPNPNLNLYRALRRQGIPILFFHTFYPELDIPHVSMNDVEAGYLATQYLISQGHTRIGAIFKLDDGQGKRRYRGYLEALHEAHLELHEEWIAWIDTKQQSEFSQISAVIWRRLEGCSACFCYNDQIARSLVESAPAFGKRIPQDISIVGIDNSELARRSRVPFTSVIHPMERLGRKVADNMLHLIETPEFQATYEFPVNIEVRESVTRVS